MAIAIAFIIVGLLLIFCPLLYLIFKVSVVAGLVITGIILFVVGAAWLDSN